MATLTGDKAPPPPPAANTEAEGAAFAAQVLEAGTTEKDRVAETVESDGDASPKAKKASAGLMNYFVSNVCPFKAVANAQ
jgi:hypothetical protein